MAEAGPSNQHSKDHLEQSGRVERDARACEPSEASAVPSDIPFLPTLAVTSPDNYGGLNPENEYLIEVVDGVHRHSFGSRSRLPSRAEPDTTFPSHSDETMSGHTDVFNMSVSGHSALLAMPPELVDAILSYLSPYDLCKVAATCRALRGHAFSDILWQPIIQDNVPGMAVRSPYPCESFRELYAEHDRLWFLPKYKIWFCDRDLPGKIILVRYDARRGCIEGFELLAVSKRTAYELWSADNQVRIHNFMPQVKLHLDKPILQFKVGDRSDDGGFSTRPEANRFADEIPMVLDDRLQHMFSNFALTKPLSDEDTDLCLARDYPYGQLWPPPTVPAHEHVRGARSNPYIHGPDPDDRPRRRCEVSDQTFRIRRWIQMGGATPVFPGMAGIGVDQMGGIAGMIPVPQAVAPVVPAGIGSGVMGAHIGEEIMTFSTLDPALYTPTPTRPWRGIWVGDYSGHGCEFLLINQPDDPPATDEELGLVRDPGETDDAWETRRQDARIYRGRLEAIKLTGDPNVPRGEYTFAADDLGPDGFVGLASEPPFEGVRVVRSKGHIAHTGFIRDKFIESQLLLIGPNKLAQYWVDFGHISFFERVDIDKHLDPTSGAS